MHQPDNTVLVVDLDGTLLKSDMLYESFWSAFSTNWLVLFGAIAALGRGRSTLKSYLQSKANIDPVTLPYNEAIIERVRAHRARGGKTALVTATNQIFADDIAKNLQIFDEVHGSSSEHNLKGPDKAKFLVERFGEEGFCYMGDSIADLPVWRVAKKVVTVNASSTVRKQAEDLGKPVEHLIATAQPLHSYIKAMRPHQWLKNMLIFLPMLLGHQFDVANVALSAIAFLSFSFVASSVYVVNDLLDLNADRSHPRKRLRPFASGAVPISHGSVLAVALLTAGILIASTLGWSFLLILAVYYLVTGAYSLSLKRKIIIDICVLAGLYTTRIIAGGIAVGVELSVWLFAFSTFCFLALAAVKRQAELIDMANNGTSKAKGRGYEVQDLAIISMMGISSGHVSVLVLALYVNSAAVRELYTFPDALWGICCVLLYWISRMVLLTNRGLMHDDPIVFALKDRVSQSCFFVMLAFAAGATLL